MGSGSSDSQGCQYSDPLEMNPSIMFLDGYKFWTPLQGRGWSKGYRLGLRLWLSLRIQILRGRTLHFQIASLGHKLTGSRWFAGSSSLRFFCIIRLPGDTKSLPDVSC